MIDILDEVWSIMENRVYCSERMVGHEISISGPRIVVEGHLYNTDLSELALNCRRILE